jgi:AraC-like DNA-binding protein
MQSISSPYLKMVFRGCCGLVDEDAKIKLLRDLFPDDGHNLENPTFRYERRMVGKLLNTTQELMNDSATGVKVGMTLRPEGFMDIGHAITLCDNLRGVLELNETFQPLNQELGKTRLEIIGDSAWLKWTPLYADKDFYAQMVEMVFSGYACIGRWLLWGEDTPVLSMHFRHDAPDDLTTHKMVFGDNTIFNSDFDGVEFIADVVDVPMPNRNPEMLAFLKTRLADQLHRLNSPISDSEEALSCILAALPEGRPSITKIAKLMGMSERTLRRRLDEDGETFRSILERARRESAETYMRANDLTHAEIALRLGFNDQSAFSRAFKSWFNQTPSEYQAALSIGA